MITGDVAPSLSLDQLGYEIDLSSFFNMQSTLLYMKSGGHNYISMSSQVHVSFGTVLTLLSSSMPDINFMGILDVTTIDVDMTFNFYLDAEASEWGLRFEADSAIFAFNLIPSSYVPSFVSQALSGLQSNVFLIKAKGTTINLCFEVNGLQCFDVNSFNKLFGELVAQVTYAAGQVANFAVGSSATVYQGLSDVGFTLTSTYQQGATSILVGVDSSGRIVNHVIDGAGSLVNVVHNPINLIATQYGPVTGIFKSQGGLLAIVSKGSGGAFTHVFRGGQKLAILSQDVLSLTGGVIVGMAYDVTTGTITFVADLGSTTSNYAATAGSGVTSAAQTTASYVVVGGKVVSTFAIDIGSSAADGLESTWHSVTSLFS